MKTEIYIRVGEHSIDLSDTSRASRKEWWGTLDGEQQFRVLSILVEKIRDMEVMT